MDSKIVFEKIQTIETLEQYAHLAARDAIAKLKEHFETALFIALGAKSEEGPVGLLLGWIESSRANVNSVFVSKAHRRQGIATQLVVMAEQFSRENGAVKIMASLSANSNSEPIRGVFKCNDWMPAVRQRFLTAMCGPEMKLADAPWLKRNLNDDRLEVFPWHEVTEGELAKLKEVEKSDDCWFPEILSPLGDTSNLHKPTSLGLRFEGELIGWVVTQKAIEGPIVFSTMFAKAISEYPLAGLKMFQDCAHRLIEISKTQEPVPVSCAIIDGNKFYEFMERRVFGYLDTTVTELDVISKGLANQN